MKKTMEFKTALSVKDCGLLFRSAITDGRGLSSKLGGLTAKMIGGQSLGFYTPQEDGPFAALNDDPPAFSVGVAVPKAYGAHRHGTNVHMYVWDRGSSRSVALWANHSLTGGAHANKLLGAVRARVER